MGHLERLAAASCLALVGLASSSCAAVYPELETRVRPAAGRQLDPPPPPDLRWIKFESGRIPETTRDGRPWEEGGGPPDTYAVILADDHEILRTPVQSDSYEPTWPKQDRGNFVITGDERIRVELWQDSPLNDIPIGVKDIGNTWRESLAQETVRVEFDSGAEVTIEVRQARAVFGLGLWYELGNEVCNVTRLLDNSPAHRAGVQKGDAVLRIQGKEVNALPQEEIRSLFNSVPVSGLLLDVRHRDGSTLQLTLIEGPIYATHAQYGNLE